MRERSKSGGTRHRILIVDDEESTRLLLARIVAHDLKAEVQLAGTCEQALKLAGSFAYDAILLDLLMPGIGGYEVLKRMRAGSANTQTPIIVVSVLEDQETVDKTLAVGASAYLLKPIERRTLVATIKAQMAARRHPGHSRG